MIDNKNLINESEKEEIEQTTTDAINDLENPTKPHIIQNGENIVNITHHGEGDINVYKSALEKVRAEKKLLKQMLKETQSFLNIQIEQYTQLSKITDDKLDMLYKLARSQETKIMQLRKENDEFKKNVATK